MNKLCNLQNVIVSLTSYPARIGTVHLTIKSLLNQTVKAEKIILWLTKEEFPAGEKELPKTLLALIKTGLTIEWCRNLRPYNKLIPALKKYPEKIIITLDDDIIYNKKTIEVLYRCHCDYPDDIIAHRITRLYFNEKDKFVEFPRSMYYDRKLLEFNYLSPLKEASFFNKLTACGGVLYPQNCLNNEVLNENKCISLAPTSDDLWFWLFGVRNKTKVRVPEIHFPDIQTISGTQDTGLSSINDVPGGFFFQHLHNILEAYPDIKHILQNENDENLKIINKILDNDDPEKKEIMTQYNNTKILYKNKKTKNKEVRSLYYRNLELMLRNNLYKNKKEKLLFQIELNTKNMLTIILAIKRLGKKVFKKISSKK